MEAIAAPTEAVEDWPRSLRAGGSAGEAALAALQALLGRAASFEAARQRPRLPDLPDDELGRIAHEAAEAALPKVLAGLDDFAATARFTTWAAKFALLETAVRLRTRAWRDRELPTEIEGRLHELPASLADAIREALTPRQRRVLVALALDGVPIDVLAERLDTTRADLYETLRAARRALRERLGAAVLPVLPEDE